MDPTSGESAVDGFKHMWHTSCYKIFHPDSLVLKEETEEAVLPPAVLAMASAPRNQLMSTAEAAAAITNRRRKSWWRPGESNGINVAALQAENGLATPVVDVPPSIPEHKPLSSSHAAGALSN